MLLWAVPMLAQAGKCHLWLVFYFSKEEVEAWMGLALGTLVQKAASVYGHTTPNVPDLNRRQLRQDQP